MHTDAPEVLALVRAAFPQANVPKGHLEVEPFKPVHPTSYWNGGGKDHWAFVRLADLQPSDPIPENGSGFTPDVARIESLPEGFALVRWAQSAKWPCATVFLHPDNITKMLPPAVALTPDEELVLVITGSLKSFARPDEARRCGIEAAQWEASKASLIAKGLLLKSGAITTEGRNQKDRVDGRSSHWLYSKHLTGRY